MIRRLFAMLMTLLMAAAVVLAWLWFFHWQEEQINGVFNAVLPHLR